MSGRTNNSAFTLVELIMVMAIIGILMSMMFVSIHKAMQNARKTRAITELRELVKAWKMYRITYEKWPSGMENSQQAMTRSAMRILRGDPDNPADNPQRKKFLNFPHDTEYRDPWGGIYKVDFSQGHTEGVDYYQTRTYIVNKQRYLYDDK